MLHETRSSLSLVIAALCGGPEQSRARVGERRKLYPGRREPRRIVEREGKEAQLKGDDLQIRNAIAVPRVVGADRIAEFERTRTNDEIRER